MPLRGQPKPPASPWPKRIIGVEFKILAVDFRDALAKKRGAVEDDINARIAKAAALVKELGFVEWKSLKLLTPADRSRLGGVFIVSLEGDDLGFGDQIWLRFSMKIDKEPLAFDGKFDERLYKPVADQPTGNGVRLRNDVTRIVGAKLGLPKETSIPANRQPERATDFVKEILRSLGLLVPLAQDATIPDRNRNLVRMPLPQDIWAEDGSGMEIRFISRAKNEEAPAILKVRTAATGPLKWCAPGDAICGTMYDLLFNMQRYPKWNPWYPTVFESRVENPPLGIYMTEYKWMYPDTRAKRQQRPS